MTSVVIDTRYLGLFPRRDPGTGHTPVFGGSVFTRQFLDAILRRGTFEKYYLLGSIPTDAFADLAGNCGSGADAVVSVTPSNCHILSALSKPVLVDLGSYFVHSLRALRRLSAGETEWPLTGTFLVVFGQTLPMWFLQWALGDARPWDALVCSTTSGRALVDAYLTALAEEYPQLSSVHRQPPFEIPIIPLGAEPLKVSAEQRRVMRERLRVDDDQAAILYFGRLSRELKCDLIPLLLAFRASQAEGPDSAHLIIAGDDTRHGLAESLRHTAAALGLAGTVSVIPNVNDADKAALHAAADVFVSPSDNIQETFGLAIIEAMSAGLPVVASDWDGYRDLVGHGQTGYLADTHWTSLGPAYDLLSVSSFPDSDGTLSGSTTVDVGQLTEYLSLLISDTNLRRSYGERGRKVFAETFSWDRVMPRYESLWAHLQAKAGTETTRRTPRTPPWQRPRIFEHYATARHSADAVLRPGDMAEALQSLPDLGAPSGDKGQAALYRDILALIAERSVPVQAVRTELGSPAAFSDLEIRLAIGRLLKYGGLRI